MASTGFAKSMLRALLPPCAVCALCICFLGFGSVLGTSTQRDYLQFGIVAANRPNPVDAQAIAMIAPVLVLLFVMQASFADLTCAKTNLLYRQPDLGTHAAQALARIAAAVFLFVAIEVLVCTAVDLACHTASLDVKDALVTTVVRWLVLTSLILAENVIGFFAPAFVGFLAVGVATAGITLCLARILLSPLAALATACPSYHVYALLTLPDHSLPAAHAAASYAYLTLLCIALGMLLAWQLGRHDA